MACANLRLFRTERGGVLQGCLVALAIVLVLGIIGGIVIFMNAKKWSSAMVVMGFKALVTEAQIPEAEKPEIHAIIDEVRNAYLDDTITLDEIGGLLGDFETNPAIAMGMIMHFDAVYVQSSALTDEEKADAALTLNRVGQGLASGALTWNDTEAIIDSVSDKTAEGNRVFRQPGQVKPEELRQAIDTARTKADDAGIPTEPVAMDLSDEFRRSIEKSLGRPIGQAP